MSTTRALVASSLRSSLVDGPGNRHVLFLQGCNFDCVACHNPSTINVCDSCAVCVDECPLDALAMSAGRIVFDLDACDGCDLCLEVCPTDSSPMAREVTVDDIIGEIRPHAAFLSGVTATGGEPTLQLDFLVDLFATIKADPDLSHLTTLVDTNGTLTIEGWERLAPMLDGAMVDLKAGTPWLHRQLTGHDDSAVRASIRWLHDHARLAEVRLLVVEGVTDTEAELDAWAGFVGGLDEGVPVRLMAFRHQGTRPQARAWPETSTDAIDRVEQRLAGYGLTNLVR
jgi:pyruvate formate lyase activating enzyme